jgi:hypothetical protein
MQIYDISFILSRFLVYISLRNVTFILLRFAFFTFASVFLTYPINSGVFALKDMCQKYNYLTFFADKSAVFIPHPETCNQKPET